MTFHSNQSDLLLLIGGRCSLETMLTSELLQTRSRYPATVDQAFSRLRSNSSWRRSPRLVACFELLDQFTTLCRQLCLSRCFPLLLLSVIGAVAHEPKNVADLVAWVRGTTSETLTTFAEHNASALQVLAIALGIVFGQSLLQSIRHYVRDKWIA